MNKQVLYIVGGLGALLAIFYLSRRSGSGATSQLAQVGQVGTAPGKDTTGVELQFKSNIFSKYTDYLKSIASGEQATKRVQIQSELEGQRIAAGTTAATLSQSGLTERERISQGAQTDRARIFADADVATVGQRSAAELQRLNLQDQLARAQMSAQSQNNALNALLRALGQLGQRGSGGQVSGGQQPQQRRTQGGRVLSYPPGIGPILTPPFNPNYPSINFPDFSSIFGGMDDFYNPFSDYYDPFYGTGTGGEGIPTLGEGFTIVPEFGGYDPYSGFSGYVDTYGGGSDSYGPFGGDYYGGGFSDAAFFDFG